jgi:hypothetical protein
MNSKNSIWALPFMTVLMIATVDNSTAAVHVQEAGSSGVVAIEAEDYSSSTPAGAHRWQLGKEPEGFSGNGVMIALPDQGVNVRRGAGPKLEYQIRFVKTGPHYVWLRGLGHQEGDSCHLDLDNQGTSQGVEIELTRNLWSWTNEDQDEDDIVVFNVDQTGLHTLSLHMREDGACIDKILITTNPNLVPRDHPGFPGSATGGVIEFEQVSSEALETTGSINILVVVHTARHEGYQVDYGVSGGTANDADYNLPPGTLDFPPGVTQKRITLKISDDKVDEDHENLVLRLKNPRGPEAFLGGKAEHTLTILDPRPTVGFGAAISGEFDTSKAASVPVVLSTTSEKPVRVRVVVKDGSATPGEDFELTLQTIEFAPGERIRSIPIHLRADGEHEGTESFWLAVRNPINARPGKFTDHKFLILEETIDGSDGAFFHRRRSDEAFEQVAKVGPHADLTIRFGESVGELVFWRGTSYLPVWKTPVAQWPFDEVIPRRGDGPPHRPDDRSRLSRVKILESTPARVMVHWRYLPDLDYTAMDGWVEERFTVYPDGVCMREIRNGRGATLEEWQSPANRRINQLMLTDQGVISLPSSWSQPSELVLAESSGDAYAYQGFDTSERCYRLRCLRRGRPQLLSFRLEAQSGLRNPAFVIEDWGDALPGITVNGKRIAELRYGFVPRMDGQDLVIWLGGQSAKRIEISLSPEGGSPPANRTPISDPYSHHPWVFPEGSTDPGLFGAFYTHLRYSREWDAEWRVGDYSDVVVQFDRSPDRFLFWRGTCNIPCWSNAGNFWYTNEFCERRGSDSGIEGLCEPMQDHECRYSHARIIHNHDARVVIHWRYAPSNSNYEHPFVDETGWGDWVDEYYFVYPDEVATRDATLYTSNPHVFNEWHEAIPLVKPGSIPEDNIQMKAVALTNIDGRKRVYSWERGFPKTFEDGLNIMLVGLKGGAKPFVITESKGLWVDEVSSPDDDEPRFNHYDDWGGWPSYVRGSDWERDRDNGYRLFWKKLPSHSSLMHFMWDDYQNNLKGPVIWKRKIMLHGLTETDDVNTLIPLSKSWEHAPRLKIHGENSIQATYDKAQRAYRLTWPASDAGKQLTLTLEASSDSPAVNPCLVIDQWPDQCRAGLSIDGKKQVSGVDYRQGIEQSTEGGQSLVIWIRQSAFTSMQLELNAQKLMTE